MFYSRISTMKGLYFTIPAGLLLATVAVLAQDKPGSEDRGEKDILAPAKAVSLDQLVKQLRDVRAQKQALEKQEKDLVETIRVKCQEQKKAIQEIEGLLEADQIKPDQPKREEIKR
jgi:hypothetical protein